MKIRIFNGPNLNLLGRREPEIYGSETLDSIIENTDSAVKSLGAEISWFQSNVEGELVTEIGKCLFDGTEAIVINPAAYTHTSIAIRDAIAATGLPCVEVHISNVFKREEFRHTSMISPVCVGTICGLGVKGYALAVEALLDRR